MLSVRWLVCAEMDNGRNRQSYVSPVNVAICQINDNLHGTAFPTIVATARQAKRPIFSFSSGQAAQGAAVVLSNDHFDGGRESALIAARVMRGESPASLPYQSITKTPPLVNPQAPEAVGLRVPESVARRAEPSRPE